MIVQRIEKLKSEMIKVKESVGIIDKKVNKLRRIEEKLKKEKKDLETTINHLRSGNDSRGLNELLKLLHSTADELISCLTLLNMNLRTENMLLKKYHILLGEKNKSMSRYNVV